VAQGPDAVFTGEGLGHPRANWHGWAALNLNTEVATSATTS
jgi:hypothetical protein